MKSGGDVGAAVDAPVEVALEATAEEALAEVPAADVPAAEVVAEAAAPAEDAAAKE